MKLENRTVLITGGTSGIGLELARQLLERGNVVIVTGRDQDRLSAAKASLPGVHAFQSDVSDPAAIAALHDTVLQQFPALDTLVNNAGMMRNLDFSQGHGMGDVAREINTNLTGLVLMVQQFLPHLLTRPDALMVNVSSSLAFIPYPAAPIYCATKAAIHSFSLSMRVQLSGTNVTVVELAPPATGTALFDAEFQKEMAGQKTMSVTALAAQAITGMEAGKLEIRPGLSNVMKAMSRIAPQFMLGQIVRMMKIKPAAA